MHVILNLCVCTNRISQVSWQVLWFQLSCRFILWRGCWSSLFLHSLQNIPKGIVPWHSTWKLHCGSSRKPAFLSSSSSLKINSSPGYLFIALFWFRYIILKLISTYIYPLKSHIVDLALKRFHKLSRSSFREIVLFCM